MELRIVKPYKLKSDEIERLKECSRHSTRSGLATALNRAKHCYPDSVSKDEDFIAVLAEDKSELLGWALLEMFSYGNTGSINAGLIQLFVKPEHRGKGISNELAAKVKELANGLPLKLYQEEPAAASLAKRFNFVKFFTPEQFSTKTASRLRRLAKRLRK